MARQVFRPGQKVQQATAMSKQTSENREGALKLQARTQLWRGAVSALDTSGHQLTDIDRNALFEAIGAEFGPSQAIPLGVMAKCYLGAPYEVHLLDIFAGHIITHYERGQSLPADQARARKLVSHPSYEFIEIYSTHLVCVRPDGSATEVAI